MKCVTPDFAIDCRAITSQSVAPLIDRDLPIDEVMKKMTVGEGNLRIASGHTKIAKVKPLKSLASRTSSLNAPPYK